VAAFDEPGLELGAERPPGFVRPSRVATTNVVALQTDFADLTVGPFLVGIRVDDHAPLAASYPTARHLRDKQAVATRACLTNVSGDVPDLAYVAVPVAV
jgi:hypothetical protein